MSNEEPIRLVLCDLLEHICDSQLHSRVQHIAKFAEDYVSDLQEEQFKRLDDSELTPQVLQEINTPTEKQVWV